VIETRSAILHINRLLFRLAFSLLAGIAPLAQSAVETSVPVSAETGTSIARDLFPVTVELPMGNLYFTDPVLQFVDSRRVGLRVRLQVYDYRPEEGIAISEMGRALVSGEPDYDPGTREVLLHNPRLDALTFDRPGEQTRRFSAAIHAAWANQVTNPIRSGLPPHPYLIPFRNNIRNLSYNGEVINLIISFR
jgi:hypothetical protein